MSVGVLAHLCHKGTFEEVAKIVGSYRFSHIQLALWKAFDNYDFAKPGLLNPGLANSIKETFRREGISISVLGCYLHLFERDEAKRRVNIERFKEILQYAKFFGAPVVATETGKLPLGDFTENDWKNLIETVKELVVEAEKWGVFIGIEAAEHHLIDDAKKLKTLLDEIDSTSLGVVLDPGNLITAKNIEKQDEVIQEMFQLLGSKIVAFQAKDCLLNENKEVTWTPVGKGQLNYDLIFKLLWDYKPHVHIILDTVNAGNMIETKKWIEEKMANSIGMKE